MSRRVHTGCSNCRRCTNSAVAESGRKAGRGYMALATGGASELVRLGTRDCRACGHKMSLHSTVTSIPQVVIAPTDSGSAPAHTLDPAAEAAKQRSMADYLEANAVKGDAKAEEWEAKAARYESRFNGKMRAANARKMVSTFREAAAKNRERAAELRRAANTIERETPESLPSAVTASAPALDFTEQLARLAELNAAGALSDEEFASAKARLLG
jgi:hypothetical protein